MKGDGVKGFLARNWFLLGFALALALAFALPDIGRAVNPRGMTVRAAIVLMFFLSGLTLPTEVMVKGLSRYPVHIYVQVFLFMLTPAWFLLTSRPLAGLWGPDVQAGMMALGCLPATISTCVVLTQMAGGSVPIAMFNSVFSNLAGVVLSPLLLALLLGWAGALPTAGEVLHMLKILALTVVLPFMVGQGLHRLAPAWAVGRKRQFSTLSGVLLLGVVCLSFAGVARAPALREAAPRLPGLFAYVLVSHAALIAMAYAGARLLGFARGERIAIVLTAPQKTLALGLPLIAAYFVTDPVRAGMALLPLLFYHPLQVFAAGLVIRMPFMRPVHGPAGEGGRA